MKNYGKVLKYNGVYGNIKSIDGGNYILLDKNVIDYDIKECDNVEFEPEFFKTSEVEIQIARYVKKLSKIQDINPRQK